MNCRWEASSANLNTWLYDVLKISDLNRISFAFLKLFDNSLLNGDFCNTLGVGFGLIGFAFEFECYFLAFNQFAVDFKFGLKGKLLGGLFDCDLTCCQDMFYGDFVCVGSAIVFGCYYVFSRTLTYFDFGNSVNVSFYCCGLFVVELPRLCRSRGFLDLFFCATCLFGVF